MIPRILITSAAFLPCMIWADTPRCVEDLVKEMLSMDAGCRGGTDSELGCYFVGIGHSSYREDNLSYSRELAEIDAKKQIASALRMSLKAHDAAGLAMGQGEDKTEVQAFVSSLTETKIDALLKGVQMASSCKNTNGEMEVVVYVTAKMHDQSNALLNAQLQWGDIGVVRAIGVDVDRAVAERNALRSAVEQVAGTLVIGKVSVNEREEMHKRLATTAGALVEEYRITKEVKIGLEFHIEVLARVNKKKLYDNYRSYFKCLDNPLFCIVATDEALKRNFTQFFTDKGFPLVDTPAESHYLIQLKGKFHDRPTPGNDKSTGTMLALSVVISAVDGSRTLLTMNERQAKDSEVMTAGQRREEVSRRIFGKLEERLHKAVQDMLVRMLDEIDKSSERTTETGTIFQ